MTQPILDLIQKKIDVAAYNLICSSNDWLQFKAEYPEGFDYYPLTAIPLLARMSLDNGALDALKDLQKEIKEAI